MREYSPAITLAHTERKYTAKGKLLLHHHKGASSVGRATRPHVHIRQSNPYYNYPKHTFLNEIKVS